MASIEVLIGEYCTDVRMNEARDEIEFILADGREFVMRHHQDCCECVTVEDIVGDLNDLIGSPILRAEEASSDGYTPEGFPVPQYGEESFTWTYYKFVTFKGYVDIRWFGSSNGYYSESVDFEERKKESCQEN